MYNVIVNEEEKLTIKLLLLYSVLLSEAACQYV